MAFIRQRNKRDCGVAALSMLCGVSYEEAYRNIPWRKRGILDGTNTMMLRQAGLKLGYYTKSTPQYRLKPLRGSTWTKTWTDIPNNSLVKVPHPKGPNYGWHWVVWKKGQIYDPARGVFRTFKSFAPPSSYMEFVKKETIYV